VRRRRGLKNLIPKLWKNMLASMATAACLRGFVDAFIILPRCPFYPCRTHVDIIGIILFFKNSHGAVVVSFLYPWFLLFPPPHNGLSLIPLYVCVCTICHQKLNKKGKKKKKNVLLYLILGRKGCILFQILCSIQT